MINTAAPLSFCTSDSHYISTELLPSLKYVSDAEKHWSNQMCLLSGIMGPTASTKADV